MQHRKLLFKKDLVKLTGCAPYIVEYDLPTRPTKQSDSRSKSFYNESVELDALPSKELRNIVKIYINRHISEVDVENIKKTENLERESTQHIIDKMEYKYGI